MGLLLLYLIISHLAKWWFILVLCMPHKNITNITLNSEIKRISLWYFNLYVLFNHLYLNKKANYHPDNWLLIFNHLFALYIFIILGKVLCIILSFGTSFCLCTSLSIILLIEAIIPFCRYLPPWHFLPIQTHTSIIQNVSFTLDWTDSYQYLCCR